jgi:hypothetical protein
MSRHLDSYAAGVPQDDKDESIVVPDVSPAEDG